MKQAGKLLFDIILYEKQYATKVITNCNYRAIALFLGETTRRIYEMPALISGFIMARTTHTFIAFIGPTNKRKQSSTDTQGEYPKVNVNAMGKKLELIGRP